MRFFFKLFSAVLFISILSGNLTAGWFLQTSNITTTLHSLYFLNSNTGWVAGELGTILKTTNGGINWIPKPCGTSVTLRSISFINSNTGWICGDNGTAKKTTDGGETWNLQSVPTPNMLSDIFIIDQDNAYIIGSNVFFRTNNGGNNWTQITGWGGNYLYFTSLSTGFNVGGNQISKTINQGTNWTMVYAGTAGIGKIMFPNSNTGCAGAGNGIFIKTTNAGNNWTSISTGINSDFADTYFNDGLTGYMIGNNGTVVKTTNGGANWSSQNSGVLGSLSEIQFTDFNNGWIVGSNGAILHTANGGVGIKQISENIPTSCELMQNYPNPFNPNTIIRYQITNNEFVQLIIFDLAGREIETIVNEKQMAGTYEIYFDGNNLTSGVYFYKLVTEGFSEIKKMVLIK
jgi:photosystem II stability/assembly factor-like uncharacterized protein